jgi:hypothetical protein
MEYQSKVTRAGYNPNELGFRLETKISDVMTFDDMTPAGIKQVSKQISRERILGQAKIMGGVVTIIASGASEVFILLLAGYTVVQGTEINPPLLAFQALVPVIMGVNALHTAQSGARESHLAGSRLEALHLAASEIETLVNYPKSNTIDLVPNAITEQVGTEVQN